MVIVVWVCEIHGQSIRGHRITTQRMVNRTGGRGGGIFRLLGGGGGGGSWMYGAYRGVVRFVVRFVVSTIFTF